MNHNPEPITPTTCQRCGKRYNTSAQHPNPYCSIACEEGRGPLPQSDPASPDYPEFIKGDPEAMVGRTLIARGFKRTCYSPDWHRKPEDYERGSIVYHDEDSEVIIYKTDVVLGKVTGYVQGHYTLDRTKCANLFLNSSIVVAKLRKDEWWAE